MKNRTITAFSAAALLTLLVAAVAFAGPHGPGKGYGAGYHQGTYAQLTPEKQAFLNKALEDFQTRTFPIRQDIWAKQTELNALANAAAPDQKAIHTLVEDIKELRTKLFAERQTLNRKLEAEGIQGFGYGRGMMGRGMGGNAPCGTGPAGCPGFNN